MAKRKGNTKGKDFRQNNKNEYRSRGGRGNRDGVYDQRRKTGKAKEMEINIDDSKVNLADLPHVRSTVGKYNNDIFWYNRLKKLFDDAVKIPFDQTLGLPLSPVKSSSTATVVGTAYTAPGIMTINLAPVIGKAVTETDPVNIAAQDLYVRVTAKNNRDGKYDRTDLMMLGIGLDSAYMLYEFLCRGYKAFRNISTDNRYFPYALLDAMKFDTQELQKNLDAMRSMINLFAYRLSSINFPDVFSFIARHSWLFAHVYKDANTEKAQTYMYMPHGFYKWVEGTKPQPNSLDYMELAAVFGLSGADDRIGLGNIQTAIDTILNPLVGSSYVGLMSSDIAMAFADSDMIKMVTLDYDEKLEPAFDEQVLMQMSNAILIPGITSNSLDITQVMSNLVAGPYLHQQPTATNTTETIVFTELQKYFNLRGEPTPDMIAEATRLMATGYYDPEEAEVIVTSSGTELVVGLNIYRYSFLDENSAPTANVMNVNQLLSMAVNNSMVNAESAIQCLDQTVAMSAFDWAPTQYVMTGTSTSGPTIMRGVVQDLDNYVYLSDQQLRLLNDAIVTSEFYTT